MLNLPVKRLFFLVALLILMPGMVLGMEKLEDSQMANVTGQEGVALDLEFRVNADSDGNALASVDNCQGLANPCNLALQFANRDATGGEWLVLKDMYGVLRFNDLQLDGSRLPALSSAFANPSRFEDQSGNCLLPNDCTPNDSLALLLTFPETAGFNADIEWRLNIGRAAVQFGPEGFLPANDNGGSFLGLAIGDTVTDIARIDIDGGIQLYGF
ncbi:MAG: DUF6160 family protein [Alcanivorax sp.]|uniref:DUF6160 family protein n=1 Tax=Alcanivorax sp. TaxID=1872427 RepID=UPI003DA6D7F9